MTCQKIPYNSKAEADIDIRCIKHESRRFSKKFSNRKYGRSQTAYLCKRCGQWHTTTVPKSIGKRLNKRVMNNECI